MSKKATEFQKREMSKMYRGKEIFKPLNTGWVDERVACVARPCGRHEAHLGRIAQHPLRLLLHAVFGQIGRASCRERV